MNKTIATAKARAAHPVSSYRSLYVSTELYNKLDETAKQMGNTSIGDVAEMLIIEGLVSLFVRAAAEEAENGANQSRQDNITTESGTGEISGGDAKIDEGTSGSS